MADLRRIAARMAAARSVQVVINDGSPAMTLPGFRLSEDEVAEIEKIPDLVVEEWTLTSEEDGPRPEPVEGPEGSKQLSIRQVPDDEYPGEWGADEDGQMTFEHGFYVADRELLRRFLADQEEYARRKERNTETLRKYEESGEAEKHRDFVKKLFRKTD